MTLVKSAAQELYRRTNGEFEIVQGINDPNGTIGAELDRDGRGYVLVAKEYSYKGLASFMTVIVEWAVNNDCQLIFYEDRNETFTVFDERLVQQEGDDSHGSSKKEMAEWTEIPCSRGCSLESYIAGRASPDTLSGENETLTVYK
ncbi:hypothetical protein [Halocatena halophila]|uniref:hypothetical protein n=1 Tax=Halocatena halophila TaxID=2814576 RepID=UPI002ED34FA7